MSVRSRRRSILLAATNPKKKVRVIKFSFSTMRGSVPNLMETVASSLVETLWG